MESISAEQFLNADSRVCVITFLDWFPSVLPNWDSNSIETLYLLKKGTVSFLSMSVFMLMTLRHFLETGSSTWPISQGFGFRESGRNKVIKGGTTWWPTIDKCGFEAICSMGPHTISPSATPAHWAQCLFKYSFLVSLFAPTTPGDFDKHLRWTSGVTEVFKQDAFVSKSRQ